MARTILLPVDLGNPAAHAATLTEALKLLEPEGTLHVVSVLPDYGYAQVSGFFRQGFEQEALKELGQRLSAWVSEAVPDGVTVHPHVMHGTVYDEILRAAGKLGVDLIVIGAHRPEFSDYLLGPNAARVVRHARQSVYVVRT
ncbi:universal stress protein [Rhodobacter sp. NSM]|uniref:universal stress protein n=1 Tax=Rhodobacter sp. NSM TaxID=3457501 RepID=UPI003FD143CC